MQQADKLGEQEAEKVCGERSAWVEVADEKRTELFDKVKKRRRRGRDGEDSGGRRRERERERVGKGSEWLRVMARSWRRSARTTFTTTTTGKMKWTFFLPLS